MRPVLSNGSIPLFWPLFLTSRCVCMCPNVGQWRDIYRVIRNELTVSDTCKSGGEQQQQPLHQSRAPIRLLCANGGSWCACVHYRHNHSSSSSEGDLAVWCLLLLFWSVPLHPPAERLSVCIPALAANINIGIHTHNTDIGTYQLASYDRRRAVPPVQVVGLYSHPVCLCPCLSLSLSFSVSLLCGSRRQTKTKLSCALSAIASLSAGLPSLSTQFAQSTDRSVLLARPITYYLLAPVHLPTYPPAALYSTLLGLQKIVTQVRLNSRQPNHRHRPDPGPHFPMCPHPHQTAPAASSYSYFAQNGIASPELCLFFSDVAS